MKIALCAKRFINNDIENNLQVIIRTIEQLSNDIDLICFGETFLQGFDCLKWNYEYDKNIGISLSDKPIIRIINSAKDNNVAVAFGYIELDNDTLYSSYLVISKEGEILTNYKRLSKGWKEPIADVHYKEGNEICTFCIDNMTFSVGLCGDLWDDAIVKEVYNTKTDITIWPVYVDYSEEMWNNSEKQEYAKQALQFNKRTLLINSVCDGANRAKGATAYFKDGVIEEETLPGKESILIVHI